MTSPCSIAPPPEPTLPEASQGRLSGLVDAIDRLVPLALLLFMLLMPLIALAVARGLG